jgi:hypothetical protein
MANAEKFLAGMPKRSTALADPLELACRERMLSMVAVLETIALDTANDVKARVAAATAILDRGYGKPAIRAQIEVNGGGNDSDIEGTIIDANEAADKMMLIAQYAGKIPFDLWPDEIKEISKMIAPPV